MTKTPVLFARQAIGALRAAGFTNALSRDVAFLLTVSIPVKPASLLNCAYFGAEMQNGKLYDF